MQNTLFVVECTRAELLHRAKVAREKFALKNMSWNLPFTAFQNCNFLEFHLIYIFNVPRAKRYKDLHTTEVATTR